MGKGEGGGEGGNGGGRTAGGAGDFETHFCDWPRGLGDARRVEQMVYSGSTSL